MKSINQVRLCLKQKKYNVLCEHFIKKPIRISIHDLICGYPQYHYIDCDDSSNINWF